MVLKNVEMTNLMPYSGRFAGRIGLKDKEDFGILDFTAPDTQRVLRKMFTEIAGAPAFDELKRSVNYRHPDLLQPFFPFTPRQLRNRLKEKSIL
jgi:hypothetical protein